MLGNCIRFGLTPAVDKFDAGFLFDFFVLVGVIAMVLFMMDEFIILALRFCIFEFSLFIIAPATGGKPVGVFTADIAAICFEFLWFDTEADKFE